MAREFSKNIDRIAEVTEHIRAGALGDARHPEDAGALDDHRREPDFYDVVDHEKPVPLPMTAPACGLRERCVRGRRPRLTEAMMTCRRRPDTAPNEKICNDFDWSVGIIIAPN